MLRMRVAVTWTCSTCLRAQGTSAIKLSKPQAHPRTFTSRSPLEAAENNAQHNRNKEDKSYAASERGVMSQRLANMAEEAMETGGRSSRKVMEDAGFSEELKKQLEARIATSGFKTANQQAISQVDMPV